MADFKNQMLVQPAEWAVHKSCWLAWPSHQDLWQESLAPCRQEVAALCRAICTTTSKNESNPQESIDLLVLDAESEKSARSFLSDLPVRYHRLAYGDIWLRDTAPIFVRSNDSKIIPVRFLFNGWGEKYSLPFDDQVALEIASLTDPHFVSSELILEGGSIDVDGEGTCLTTTQCLLNPNRNPNWTKPQIEAELQQKLGIQKILWLSEGLVNDHTDGHIDNIARFIAPGVVMCMEALSPDDPHRFVLKKIAEELSLMKDAEGRPLKVLKIPSPGKILSDEGEVMPASYTNFYIANHTVIVPTYGSPYDQSAVEKIAEMFPDRKTIGLSAIHILGGGGSFHCITQQQPLSLGES